MRQIVALGSVLALCGCLAATAQPGHSPAAERRGPVSLPGVQYEVLQSGPVGGRRPTRADMVEVRYVGRLANGEIFSTSADNGRGISKFAVRTVIPGFSALIQLMRPGDRWRFTIPSYLAYGSEGRRHIPPEETLKRDVPPDSTLIFDVELVAITPGG